MMAYWRLRMVLHLFSGLATCAFIFPFVGPKQREHRVQRWSKKLLAICGIRVQVKSDHSFDITEHALVVANHISWLDIFVINSLYPCRFVAKSDIRDWPLIGWLCERAGTIFIARGRQRDVRRIYAGLVTYLRQIDRVAFFPEGKTSLQGTVLPFHANLFEAAIEADVPVQPCALRYLDKQGNLHPAVEFVGDTGFMQSVIMILKSRGMVAELVLLPQISVNGAHRRDLASQAHDSIKNALGWMDKPDQNGLQY